MNGWPLDLLQGNVRIHGLDKLVLLPLSVLICTSPSVLRTWNATHHLILSSRYLLSYLQLSIFSNKQSPSNHRLYGGGAVLARKSWAPGGAHFAQTHRFVATWAAFQILDKDMILRSIEIYDRQVNDADVDANGDMDWYISISVDILCVFACTPMAHGHQDTLQSVLWITGLQEALTAYACGKLHRAWGRSMARSSMLSPTSLVPWHGVERTSRNGTVGIGENNDYDGYRCIHDFDDQYQHIISVIITIVILIIKMIEYCHNWSRVLMDSKITLATSTLSCSHSVPVQVFVSTACSQWPVSMHLLTMWLHQADMRLGKILIALGLPVLGKKDVLLWRGMQPAEKIFQQYLRGLALKKSLDNPLSSSLVVLQWWPVLCLICTS